MVISPWRRGSQGDESGVALPAMRQWGRCVRACPYLTHHVHLRPAVPPPAALTPRSDTINSERWAWQADRCRGGARRGTAQAGVAWRNSMRGATGAGDTKQVLGIILTKGTSVILRPSVAPWCVSGLWWRHRLACGRGWCGGGGGSGVTKAMLPPTDSAIQVLCVS